MSYWEWKLNQELANRSTFNHDEKFYKEYQEYLKNEYRQRPGEPGDKSPHQDLQVSKCKRKPTVGKSEKTSC